LIKQIADRILAFDIEWVPDPVTGRMVYGMKSTDSDQAVMERMWEEARIQEAKYKNASNRSVDDEKPADDHKPYLKTALCRIVSIAVVYRREKKGELPEIRIETYPKLGAGPIPEAELLRKFFAFFDKSKPKPQLVGFNSSNADVPILVQRGMALNLCAQEFSSRPDKPWEGRDYFARYGEGHLDLRDIVSGWGKASVTLHEAATSCGIPGKIDVSGDNVIELWLSGDSEQIVQYNVFDALTTYLLWLRCNAFSGLIGCEAYEAEVAYLRAELQRQAMEDRPFLQRYLDKWAELDALAATR
jgi:predicted PolB exonuclease-like 3'-5' exonuclease